MRRSVQAMPIADGMNTVWMVCHSTPTWVTLVQVLTESGSCNKREL